MRHATVAGILAASVAASLVVFFVLRDMEAARHQADFKARAIQYTDAVDGNVPVIMARVEGIRQLFAASTKVDAHELAEFVRFFPPDTHIQAYAWVPRVSDAEREAFEDAARHEGPRDYVIREAVKGVLEPAARRPEHYPVRYVSPLSGNELAFGFDLGSEPGRLRALDAARDSGQTTVTEPVSLVHGDGHPHGILVVVPHYKNGAPAGSVEERRKNLEGFAIGVVRIGDLLESILSKVKPGGVDVLLRDLSVPGEPKVLHVQWSRSRLWAEPRGLLWFEQSPVRHREVVAMGGRSVEVIAVAAPEYLRKSHCPWPVTILVLGLVIAAASTSVAALLLHRKATAEDLAAEKTRALSESLAELRESEARFRKVFEDSAAATLLLEQGWIADCNRAALKMLGGHDMTQLRRTPIRRLAWELQPESPCSSVQTAEEGSSTCEWEYLARGGEPRLAEALITPIRYQERDLLHVVLRDITERRRAERAVVRESARLSALLESATDGIHIVDHQGKLVLFSPSFARMLGYAPEEAARLNIVDWDENRQEPLLSGSVQTHLRTPATFETRHRRKDGSVFDVEISSRPIELDGERLVYASSRDISDRKRDEASLRKAKQEAEEASLAKSRFLATMSHELRTPMNGILGMAQVLLMPGIQEEERKERARTILRSGQTLLTLLNDILDLSKIEAGKLDLVRSPFEPHKLLEELTDLFYEPSHEKGLAIHTTWSGPASQRYLVDPLRLRQMVSNLVNNAIKFTNRGTIRIEAGEVERRGTEASLMFSVSDTGIGIPPSKRGALFAPFSQVDSSNTRRFGGTGLGLSIVQNLAKMMGGEVGVDSIIGLGSKFWFRIVAGLAAPDQDRPDNHSSTSSPPRSRKISNHPKGRVLVVEDVKVNRVVIEIFLDKLGYAHHAVSNGEEAVSAVTAGETADLVLMDCQMPLMDGYEATQRIRRWEAEQGKPRLPIVALTAAAYDEDRERCHAAGMDDFLPKPVDLSKLTTLLGKWLAAPS